MELSKDESKNENSLDIYHQFSEKEIERLTNAMLPSGIYEKAKKMLTSMVDFKELLMVYSCAIKEVKTKFEVLNTEFNTKYSRNPICAIQTRLKSNSSIIEKLFRKKLPFNIETIKNEINDIAGVRIICTYKDDIFKLAESFVKQDDITLIEKKDYITNPKANGYRSYHLIVSVPVFFSDHKQNIKVEVQIRTIAMDFWASLEHQLKYKQDVPEQDKIVKRLKACADVISATDCEMMDIRKNIEAAADVPTEDDELFEKLKHFSEPIQF